MASTSPCWPFINTTKPRLQDWWLSASSFVFAGFLPTKAGERDQAIALSQADTRATVILEAPHRIEALARALALLQGRLITVGRELTKQFEEIATMPAQDFAGWLAAGPQRTRGEFALVLHASAPHDGQGTLTQSAAAASGLLPFGA